MKAIDIRRILPVLAALLAFYALSVAYFSPVLEGQQLVQSDIRQYRGMAQELVEHRAVEEDEPFWTGSMFGGMPAYQIGVKWPATALDVVDRFFHGFLPRPASFLFLYMLGMFVLLRCLRLNNWVALVGAVAYGFATYYLVVIEAGHTSKANAMGYMPMVFGGFYLLLRGQRWWGAALFALFLALQIKMNHVQVTYYLGFLLVLFAVAEVVRALREKSLPDLLGRFGLGAVGLVFALLCNLGMLWGTMEYSVHTTRGPSELTIHPDGSNALANKTSGLDRDYVTQWSYGRQESLTFLVPDAKGGGSGPIVSTREQLDALADPVFRNDLTQRLQAGQGVNSYWGDQLFTSGPVYGGVIVVLLLLLLLVRLRGPAAWWALAALPLLVVATLVQQPVVLGVLVLGYLVAGAFLWREPLPYALFAALVLTLLLSWGRNLMPLTDFFLDHVPGYNKFRAVTIILVIVDLSIVVLGALYLDRFLKEGKWNKDNERSFRIGAGALVAVMLLLIAMPGTFLEFFSANEKAALSAEVDAAGANAGAVQRYIDGLRDHRIGVFRADAFRSLAFILLAAALLWAYGKERLGRTVVVAGLGLLVLVDLWGVDKRYLNNEKNERGQYLAWEDPILNQYPYRPQPVDMAILQAERTAATDAAYAEGLKKIRAERADKGLPPRLVPEEEGALQFGALRRTADHYRVVDIRGTFQESRTSYFHRSVGGYHGAKLKRYQELYEFHLQPELNATLQVLSGGPLTPERLAQAFEGRTALNMLNTRYLVHAADQPPIVNPNGAGAAWFVDEVREVPDADSEIRALSTIDLKRTAVVHARDHAVLAGAARPDSNATARMLKYGSNELIYEVNSGNGGVVVFSEIWYGPDWKAEIDGVEAPYVRADYVLRAMAVPAGKHTIRFHAESRAYSVGGRIAMIASWVLMLALAAVGYTYLRRRKQEQGAAA